MSPGRPSAGLGAWYAALGAAFGWVLSRSGAADFGFIQRMFLFEHVQLYGILASAVVVTGLGLRVLRRAGRTLGGAPIVIRPKGVHRGNLVGGAVFGMGWAITGMCPGPILVNLGEGKLYALGALAGAFTGAALFGSLYPRLQPLFGLPPFK